MGYLDKSFGDIEHKSWRYKPPELRDYGIFRPKAKVIGYGILLQAEAK